jgi:hypothetical protein
VTEISNGLVQIDGEPWLQTEPVIFQITFLNQGRMLARLGSVGAFSKHAKKTGWLHKFNLSVLVVLNHNLTHSHLSLFYHSFLCLQPIATRFLLTNFLSLFEKIKIPQSKSQRENNFREKTI